MPQGLEEVDHHVPVGEVRQPSTKAVIIVKTAITAATRRTHVHTSIRGASSMHDKGLLGADNIFNHCTRLTDSEWRLLQAAGVHVTVNPRSDALFGFEAGLMPFQTAIDYGLKPASGVDVDTSMKRATCSPKWRTAFFLQRSIAEASVCPWQERHAIGSDGARDPRSGDGQ